MKSLFMSTMSILNSKLENNESLSPNNMEINVSSSSTLDCLIPQEFFTNKEFFACWREVFLRRLGFNIVLVLMAFFTVLFNAIVIISLARKELRSNIFNKLIICHCFIDAVTGGLDAPFYITIDMFNYWPLSPTLGLVWTAFDSGINTVNNTSMLYLTYVRMRSIKAPNTFEKELLIRRPYFMIILYWIIGKLIIMI